MRACLFLLSVGLARARAIDQEQPRLSNSTEASYTYERQTEDDRFNNLPVLLVVFVSCDGKRARGEISLSTDLQRRGQVACRYYSNQCSYLIERECALTVCLLAG